MMWKVRFTDYLKFEYKHNGRMVTVKEGIENTKRKKKNQKKLSSHRIGNMLEDSMQSIFEDGGVMKVTKQNPQYDMGFGADFIFAYQKGSKNYSFFVDVTSRTDEGMRYFGLNGELVDGLNDAFCYYTDEFSVYLSVKYNHHGFFFYEKPVISLVVKKFGKEIDVDKVEVSHGTNLSNVMIALHEYLCEEGYGARANHYVRPNIKLFYDEYKKSKGSR